MTIRKKQQQGFEEWFQSTEGFLWEKQDQRERKKKQGGQLDELIVVPRVMPLGASLSGETVQVKGMTHEMAAVKVDNSFSSGLAICKKRLTS